MGKNKDKISPAKFISSFVYVLIWPALLLWLSGDWGWTEGWIFAGWFVILCYSTIIYLFFRNPGLLAERFKGPGARGQKRWDIYFVISLVIVFTIWFVIMPLDASRYHWTTYFPIGLKVLGAVMLLGSFYLFFRSYVENSYLSPLVRIQTERKQVVISSGVYGFVRHPMYLGASLLFFGTPLLLGSKYGILIGLSLFVMIAARIIGEEKMLSAELEGYDEYKNKVRYRLVPYVW